MLFKGPYRIRKVLAIKSNKLNVIFVVDRVTWSNWMRTLKYEKKFVANYLVYKPRGLSCKKGICDRNAEACKSVKIGSCCKLCKSELFVRLVVIIVTSHLVLGSSSFLGFFPSVVTQRNPLEFTLSNCCN